MLGGFGVRGVEFRVRGASCRAFPAQPSSESLLCLKAPSPQPPLHNLPTLVITCKTLKEPVNKIIKPIAVAHPILQQTDISEQPQLGGTLGSVFFSLYSFWFL